MSNAVPNLAWSDAVYSFPKLLTISDDDAIDKILSDVPFFAVGLLGFGVFTFFFVMRQIKLLTIYLYSAVLFAFVASIFDLSQILARENRNVNDGADLDSVPALIIIREVGFSLSFGLRFLFFWTFVAERPRNDIAPTKNEDIANGMSHCGSWARWGIIGTVFKWVSLFLSITIPILQILWRVVNNLNQFGPVYTTESIIELVVSTIFVSKLLLNTALMSPSSRWGTIKYYAAPIVAIWFGKAIVIGNMAVFAFSESTLGRFLQTVELYILILFLLISTFYNLKPDESAQPVDAGISSESFKQLPEKISRQSTFRISPPRVSTPDPAFVAEHMEKLRAMGELDAGVGRSQSGASRISTVSRVSTWIGNRLSRRPSEADDRNRLWNVGEAELGTPSPEEDMDAGDDMVRNSSITGEGPRQAQQWQDPVYTSISPTQKFTAETSQTPVSTPTSPTPETSTRTRPTPQQRRHIPMLNRFTEQAENSTAITGPPHHSNGTLEVVAATPLLPNRPLSRHIESPVYGLNGIVRQPSRRNSRPGPRMNGSVVSIDELLRQQQELDKSIENLGLLTPRVSVSVQPKEDSQQDSEYSPASRLESASMRSEFSLSNFPVPPWSSAESPNSGVISTLNRSSPDLADTTIEKAAASSPPMSAPAKAHENTLLPVSPRKSQDTVTPVRKRYESSGTQWNVTSFIDDPGLSTPQQRQSSSKLSDIESTNGSAQSVNTATILTAQARPATAARSMFTETSAEASGAVIQEQVASGSFLGRTTKEVSQMRRGGDQSSTDASRAWIANKTTRGHQRDRVLHYQMVPPLKVPLLVSTMSQFPDYYSLLDVPKNATQDDIRQAYKRESLRTHPDRLTNATPEEKKAATGKFQAVADAYYVLSDNMRRREYDTLYSSRSFNDKTSNPNASNNFFANFASMFSGGTSGAPNPERPDAEGVFADVFDELLRPEVERVAPWWSYLGAVCGGGIGFIVANVPGLMLGAFAGNRLGAVRDAKGKSVASVFSQLGGSQKADILRALAMKVLGSAL